MISLAIDDEHRVATTTEELLQEWSKDFLAEEGANLAVRFSAIVQATGGTGTFRIRIGGTPGAVDGSTVASVSPSSPTAAQPTASGTIAKPLGAALVKLTGVAPAAGTATIRGAVITVAGSP